VDRFTYIHNNHLRSLKISHEDDFLPRANRSHGVYDLFFTILSSYEQENHDSGAVVLFHYFQAVHRIELKNTLIEELQMKLVSVDMNVLFP
jgi:hypothetical protein